MRLAILVLCCFASSARAQGNPDGGKDINTAAANTAVSSQPQVPGLRGGTIGIPSEGASAGLQALLSNQLSTKGADTDAFAKLGGIKLNDTVSVEILGEIFQASLPRVLIDGMPPLPQMFSTKISDVGFRFRIRLASDAPKGVTKHSIVGCLEHRHAAVEALPKLVSAAELQALAERANQTARDWDAAKHVTASKIEAMRQADIGTDDGAKARAKQAAGDAAEAEKVTRDKAEAADDEWSRAQGNFDHVKNYKTATECSGIDLGESLSDVEWYTRELSRLAAGWTLTAGTRFLRRSSSESDGQDSQGISAEAALQYIHEGESLGVSWFVSGSTMHLGGANDKVGTTPALFPKDAGWMREHISKNRLAIIPDKTHYEIFMAPELATTVLPFLDGKSGSKSWSEQQAASARK